jgi:hypothetical protein
LGLLDDSVQLLRGPYEQTLADAPIESIGLIHLGEGVGESAETILDLLYDRLVPGGFVVIDDLTAPETEKAVEAFRTMHGSNEPLVRASGSSGWWRRDADSAG